MTNVFTGSCGEFRFRAKPNVVMATAKEVDFDQSTITEDPCVEFTVPNYETAYTIEVTAEGMSISSSLTVGANPIVVSDLTQEVSAD